MSTPNPPEELLDLATPYALHALDQADRDNLELQLIDAENADAFFDEVRAVRETLAAVSAATALEPPSELRAKILTAAADDSVRPLRKPGRRWQTAALGAAAALVIGLGAVGIGVSMRPTPEPSTAQLIFAAPDVRTVSGQIPTGGTATFVFSHERDAGVLVMNNVAPPTEGTVYQMWLVDAERATSAGTMDAATVSPSTTAVVPDLGSSTALAFTVEPGTGSTQPTGAVFAELPLS
ncbi:anti-sigma factor [[Mycobacterium] burgundiense]|uniref:Anti-sigma-K factor RskA n=1 Tax=[Mycobacterium] burgundiense TaxID=3064286 RepID=A0ABM9LD30_9MYCO|nr:anti-sigma factor [Mycolicibacterium sp. MU0053]CAJ1496927.1 anti-sigma factor [Mycolicibacterium sp. MU0053]